MAGCLLITCVKVSERSVKIVKTIYFGVSLLLIMRPYRLYRSEQLQQRFGDFSNNTHLFEDRYLTGAAEILAAIIIRLPVADPIKFSGGKSFPTEKAKRRTQNPVREGRGEGVSSQILTIKMGSINSININ